MSVDMPSERWLALAEGLYYGVLAELHPEADLDSCKGMLDALEWRMQRQITETEFTAIFMAWRQPELDPSIDFGQATLGMAGSRSSRGEEEVQVSGAQFCMELGGRKITEEELTLMFGMVVNELNKVTLARFASNGHLETVRMRLALAEKVFFNIDTLGRGYVTVDDMLSVVLSHRRQAEAAGTTRFGPGQIAVECMEKLQEFGSSGFYQGIVTLKRFKAYVTQENEKTGQFLLSDMALQKILIELNQLPMKVGGLWVDTVKMELDRFKDGETIQLSRFLSIRGPRIRWRAYEQGKPFGTDHEIRALWDTFYGGRDPSQYRNLFSKLERVVFRYVSALNNILTKLFPYSYDPSEHDFFTSSTMTSQQNGSVSSPSYLEEDSSIIPGYLDVTETSTTSEGETTINDDEFDDIEEDEFDDAIEHDDDEQNRDVITDEEEFEEYDHDTKRIDGAFYIEAFRLFQAEKVKTLGVSRDEASKLWQDSSIEERKVYVEMAKVSRKRPGSGYGRPGKSFAAPAPCKVLREHAEFLESAVSAYEPTRRIVNRASWSTFTIDSVLEHVLSSRFEYSNIRNVKPPHAYDPAYHGEKPTETLFKAATAGKPLFRQGILHAHVGPLQQRQAFLYKLDLSCGVLQQCHPETEELLDSFVLHGAHIGSSIAPLNASPKSISHRFIVSSAEGKRSWALYAESQALVDQWIADLCFVIGTTTVKTIDREDDHLNDGDDEEDFENNMNVNQQFEEAEKEPIQITARSSSMPIAVSSSISSTNQPKRRVFVDSPRNAGKPVISPKRQPPPEPVEKEEEATETSHQKMRRHIRTSSNDIDDVIADPMFQIVKVELDDEVQEEPKQIEEVEHQQEKEEVEQYNEAEVAIEEEEEEEDEDEEDMRLAQLEKAAYLLRRAVEGGIFK